MNKNILVINLGEGMPASRQEFLSQPILEELNLLTAKQQIYLLNGNEGDVSEELKIKSNY